MVAKDKQKLRAHFFALRSSLRQDQISFKNQQLKENILEYFAATTGGIWGAYRAMDQEASLDAAIADLRQKGMRFCFPRITARAGEMAFHEVLNWQQDFLRHEWGIWEPRPECALVDATALDGVFVPLLAFDDRGTRLGKGKAFYDRYLADFKGPRIGLAFEWQHSSYELPREDHDVTLTAVITETRVYRFNN